MSDVLHQTSRTVLAQSALLDSLALLVQRQAERIELLAAEQQKAAMREGQWLDELAELRDFVHGLNDRTNTHLLEAASAAVKPFRCFMRDDCENTVPHVHVPYTYADAERAGIHAK